MKLTTSLPSGRSSPAAEGRGCFGEVVVAFAASVGGADWRWQLMAVMHFSVELIRARSVGDHLEEHGENGRGDER